jgi:hypothetical protein
VTEQQARRGRGSGGQALDDLSAARLRDVAQHADRTLNACRGQQRERGVVRETAKHARCRGRQHCGEHRRRASGGNAFEQRGCIRAGDPFEHARGLRGVRADEGERQDLRPSHRSPA